MLLEMYGMDVLRMADSQLKTMSFLSFHVYCFNPHIDKINILVWVNQFLTIRDIGWILLRDFDRKIEDAWHCGKICVTFDDV
jgi:hypothetical protein